jgi:hypothetical protein
MQGNKTLMALQMLILQTSSYPQQVALPEMFYYFQNCTAADLFNFSPRSDNGNDQN